MRTFIVAAATALLAISTAIGAGQMLARAASVGRSVIVAAPLIATPAFPSGAAAREMRILTKVSSQTRAWIKQEGAKEAVSNTFSEEVAESAVQNHFGVTGDNSPDITALTFLVLMEAARSAQSDLNAVMDGVKQINKQKQALRDQITALKADPTTSPDMLSSLQNKLDSLTEMGETESLRLQMATDRVTKFMQILSNMQKKASDTDAGITQNLK